MRLVITSEYRFSLASDGPVWTKVAFDYSFWQRYLSVFDSVRVVARAQLDREMNSHYKPVTGAGIEFWPVPFYLGPEQFLIRRAMIRRSLLAAAGEEDALLCRVGSPLADELLPHFWKTNRPYGLEVVGDPNEALGPGTNCHPLRPLFRARATRSLRKQCSRAVAVAYVTRERLQRQYPCPAHSVGISDVARLEFKTAPKVFATNYSSISCEDTDFVERAREFGRVQRPQLVFVGSFAQMYKGPDVLIRAVRHLAPEIIPVITMIGDGKHRAEMEKLTTTLGVSEYFHFVGEVTSGQTVRDQLDRATLLVMPSRTEGLPRAMIEGMARALPCIGTRVGGIPELLPDEDLVDAGDVKGLANKIKEVVTNPYRLSRMSARNLVRAQEFRPELLEKRRTAFYRFLRDATEIWRGTETVNVMAKGATT